MGNKITCPYCKCEFSTYHDGATNYDTECPECEGEIEVSVEFDPIYSCCKTEYFICPICGKEERFEGTRGPKPEGLKHLSYDEYKKVCYSCFAKEYKKDIDAYKEGLNC